MTKPVKLRYAQTFDAAPARAFDIVRLTPLEEVFNKRFWAIPPIKGVRDQTGGWSSAGESRTILMDDGGTLLERLTEVDAPRHFAYTITEVSGPMKPLVASAQGRWTFVPKGDGVDIIWTWTVQPRALSGPLMPVFGWLWKGNARQGFERLRELLSVPVA